MQVFGEIVPAAASAESAATQNDGDRGDPEAEDDDDEDEDDDDDDTGRTTVPRRGTKRKLETQENEMEGQHHGQHQRRRHVCYSAQRQSVFNVFMCKLHRYRQVPDPSLLRSVLICNTLRSIEREMVRDGFEPDVANDMDAETVSANFVSPAFQQQPDDVDESMDSSSSSPIVVAEPIDQVADSSAPTYTAMMPLEPDCPPKLGVGYEKSLGDLDCSGRATPYPSPDLDPCRTIEDVDDEDNGRQGINWSSVLNFSSQADVDAGIHPVIEEVWTYDEDDDDDDDDEEDVEEEEEDVEEDEDDEEDEGDRTMSSGGPNTSPSASSDSGISTASDEIFGDIDLSLYDFDLVPLSPPSGARQAVLPPSAEELLCSFPGERTIVLPPASGLGALALPPSAPRHRVAPAPSVRFGDAHRHVQSNESLT